MNVHDLRRRADHATKKGNHKAAAWYRGHADSREGLPSASVSIFDYDLSQAYIRGYRNTNVPYTPLVTVAQIQEAADVELTAIDAGEGPRMDFQDELDYWHTLYDLLHTPHSKRLALWPHEQPFL